MEKYDFRCRNSGFGGCDSLTFRVDLIPGAGRIEAWATILYGTYHRLKDIGGQMKPAPVKPGVTFDDLQKLDIRVGTIESIDDVKGSKKLVKLTVNFGDHTRTVLAGIKEEREDPSEITGKQALFVINIPPRRMAGEESQGMLLDIGYEDGVAPVLAVPESIVPNGTRAG